MADQVITGDWPNGFTVTSGQTWAISGLVTSAKNVVVPDGARLEMRPGATLEFRDIVESTFGAGGGLVAVATDIGLWVEGGGILDAQGTAKSSWHWANASISAGATSVTLQEPPSGWLPGDRIIITPTKAPTTDTGDKTFVTDLDDLVIQSVAGATITFTSPAVKNHPSCTLSDGRTFYAEVANLTRDVKIRGRTTTGRTHIFIHAHEQPIIKYIEVSHVTPMKSNSFVLGRWGIHIHHGFDETIGLVIEGVAMYDLGGRGIVQHASHGTTARDCVVYGSAGGDHFWWDRDVATDDSNDTVWDHCLSIAAGAGYFYGSQSVAQVLRAGSGFLMTGGLRNSMLDCVATGGRYNTSGGGISWDSGIPGNRDFDATNIVAHNNVGSGIRSWLNEESGQVTTNAVAYRNGDGAFVGGAYNGQAQWIDIVAEQNRPGPSTVNASNQTYLTCVFDANGGAYAAKSEAHPVNATPDTRIVMTECEFKNYTTAGFLWNTGTNEGADRNHSEFYHLVDCTFDGNEFWLGNLIEPGSKIEIDDAEHGNILLRRYDREGDFVPEWNARVVSLDNDPAVAPPAYIGAGAVATGTGAVTPALPAGYQANDVFLAFTQTKKGESVAAPSGWTELPNSPQSGGVINETTGVVSTTKTTQVSGFWMRAASAAETAPTFADPGDHIVAVITAYRGCRTNDVPYDTSVGAVDQVDAKQIVELPGGTTTVANTLIVHAATTSLDTLSAQYNFAWTGFGVDDPTTRVNQNTNLGLGGGIGIVTATRGPAGVFAETVGQQQSDACKAYMTVALAPSANPTYVGSGLSATGTAGTIQPPLPAGWAENDIFLMACEWQGGVLTTPTGWTAVTGSPRQSTGVATVATNLSVFWRLATASDTDPSVTFTSDHVLAVITAYRGCPVDADPWNVLSGGVDNNPNTSLSVTGATTTTDGCLVVVIATVGTDAAGSVVSGTWTNADLTNVTPRVGIGTTTGNGGGIVIATGEKAQAGAYGATTNTLAATGQRKAFATLALRRAGSQPDVELSAAAEAASSGSGRLTIGSTLDLSADAAASSSGTGDLSATRPLSGTAEGTSTMAAALTLVEPEDDDDQGHHRPGLPPGTSHRPILVVRTRP